MRITVERPAPPTENIMTQFFDGLRYARASRPIKSLLLLVAFVCLVGMPYTTLLPVIARDILHGDSATYGYLMSAAGIGAVCGALYLASRRADDDLWRYVASAPIIFGLGLIALAASQVLFLSLIVLAIVAFGMMTVMATANTLLQNTVSETMRGRVMSLYTLAFFGSVPFGNLLAGSLATHLGAPATLLIAALLSLGAAGFFLSRYKAISSKITATE
jgi:predicted MFS family arabinose efflux permease